MDNNESNEKMRRKRICSYRLGVGHQKALVLF
jgi:hypothetical protein